jgi:hypothetical protein
MAAIVRDRRVRRLGERWASRPSDPQGKQLVKGEMERKKVTGEATLSTYYE